MNQKNAPRTQIYGKVSQVYKTHFLLLEILRNRA